MSTLPLMFKKKDWLRNISLKASIPSDRYFSRAVLVNRTASGYAAKVMYEALTVEGGSHSTIAAAVKELVQKLQASWIHRLRSRANFKGTRYLAEKETWIEYQDRS